MNYKLIVLVALTCFVSIAYAQKPLSDSKAETSLEISRVSRGQVTVNSVDKSIGLDAIYNFGLNNAYQFGFKIKAKEDDKLASVLQEGKLTPMTSISLLFTTNTFLSSKSNEAFNAEFNALTEEYHDAITDQLASPIVAIMSNLIDHSKDLSVAMAIDSGRGICYNISDYKKYISASIDSIKFHYDSIVPDDNNIIKYSNIYILITELEKKVDLLFVNNEDPIVFLNMFHDYRGKFSDTYMSEKERDSLEEIYSKNLEQLMDKDIFPSRGLFAFSLLSFSGTSHNFYSPDSSFDSQFYSDNFQGLSGTVGLNYYNADIRRSDGNKETKLLAGIALKLETTNNYSGLSEVKAETTDLSFPNPSDSTVTRNVIKSESGRSDKDYKEFSRFTIMSDILINPHTWGNYSFSAYSRHRQDDIDDIPMNHTLGIGFYVLDKRDLTTPKGGITWECDEFVSLTDLNDAFSIINTKINLTIAIPLSFMTSTK